MPDKQQNTEDIDVRLVQTPSDFEGAKKLRFKVFVEEQGVPFKEETDQFDIVASHAVAVKSWQIVGTGRMFVDPSGEAKIGTCGIVCDKNRKKGLLLTACFFIHLTDFLVYR